MTQEKARSATRLERPAPPPARAAPLPPVRSSGVLGAGGAMGGLSPPGEEQHVLQSFFVTKTRRDSSFPGFKISTLRKKAATHTSLDIPPDHSTNDAPSSSSIQDAPPMLDPLPSEETLLQALSPEAAQQIQTAFREGLDRLDLTGLRLGFLPATVAQMTQLTILNLAGNNLDSLPALEHLTELQEMDLSFNPDLAPMLSAQQDQSLALPSSLMNLVIRNGSLSALSSALMEQLPFLSGVDLRFNVLTSLPDALIQHRFLCELLLGENKLQSLSLGKSRLRLLDVSRNALTFIEFSSPDPSQYLMERLILSHNRLTSVPRSIEMLHTLTTMDLSHNQITELPKAFGSLRKLRILKAPGNRIASVLFSLAALGELRTLNLAYNCLSAIPSGLDKLTNLLTLNLSGNAEISDLSAIQWNVLSQLGAVMMSGAKVSQLPETLYSHPTVAVLYLGYNRLTEVALFSSMGRLRMLSLAGNQICHWPEEALDPDGNDVLEQLSLVGNAPTLVFAHDETKFPHLRCDIVPPPFFDLENAGFAETIGIRATMEDRILVAEHFEGCANVYAIFDGHSGTETSDYCFQHLLSYLQDAVRGPAAGILPALGRAIVALDREVCKLGLLSGATAVVVVNIGRELFVANVGDAEALLVSPDRVDDPLVLTVPHLTTSESEAQRIRQAGGLILDGRLDGIIEVTRSIGDSAIPLCIAEPYLYRCTAPVDSLLVLGCDGLYDELSPRIISKLALRYRDNPFLAAHFLRDEAFYAGSTDNISCIVARIAVSRK